MTKEELLIDLIAAYKDARKRIRNRAYQLTFEQNLESELIQLRDELWTRQWSPMPSDAFIVFRPVQREVFASQFRDRIVHHLLYNYISPTVDRTFIRDSYSCRKGKGTSDAVKRLNHHLMSATDNFRKGAYMMKMDIRGYFMSIDHKMLESIINKQLNKHLDKSFDRNFIDYLVHTIISNDVTDMCVIRGKRSDWNGLPSCKSLFNNNKGVGLPIGDLTSQLFSNIYLNELDQYVKRTLKCKHYGRYVDDFFIIDNDIERLLSLKDQIGVYLKDTLGLNIHPRKTLIQPAAWPVSFMGHRIHPYYSTPSRRSVHQFKRTVMRIRQDVTAIYRKLPYGGVIDDTIYSYLNYFGEDSIWTRAVNRYSRKLESDMCSLNSYLGYFRQDKSFRMVSGTLLPAVANSEDNPLLICFRFDKSLKKARLSRCYKHKYLTV